MYYSTCMKVAAWWIRCDPCRFFNCKLVLIFFRATGFSVMSITVLHQKFSVNTELSGDFMFKNKCNPVTINDMTFLYSKRKIIE